jgi:hypothetical protein
LWSILPKFLRQANNAMGEKVSIKFRQHLCIQKHFSTC